MTTPIRRSLAAILAAPAAALALAAFTSACRDEPATPLAAAAAAGRTEEVRNLLARGAPADQADRKGLTPLIWASRYGRLEAMRLLLDAGADPDRPGGGNDWPPLMHAIHKNRDEAARLLLEAGARADGPGGARALMMAAGYGNAGMARELLARGADPHARFSGGVTALTNAVGGAWDIDYRWSGCGNHTETVRALLAADPDLNLEDNFWNRFALRYAKRKGCDEMLALVGR